MAGPNFRMDELKTKFLDLIHLPNNSKIPIVGFPIEETQVEVETKDATVSGTKEERPSDQEILESIDPKYFASESEFDLGRYELEKFASSNMDKIESGLKYLKEQQLVVSNHVLQMILEKQSACQEEFERITQIQNEVDQVLSGVKNGRFKLGVATRHFTTASLGILANYRKRTLAQKLLYYLNTIKTLHKTESKLRELLNTGDYPSAIALLLECQNVASTYKHFSCVAALSLKLKETLEMAEEKLDNKLAEMCRGFDENVYEKLQSAYSLLGKTQVAMDQFPMHFTSAVQTTASNVVHSFTNQRISQELQYSEMCKEVLEENFIPCLLTLCKSLWVIVLSYHQVVAWHQKNAKDRKDDDFESNLNEEQIKKKLHKGYSRLWHDVQTRVSLLVMAADLSFFKIDDFLQVLGILHRLTQIGEEFCDSESEEVTSSIRTKSSDYFISYHSARMDDLKVFLENEAWTQCPVRSDFSLLHLEEFRGIRISVEQCAGVSSRLDSSFDSSSTGINFFTRFPNPDAGTPFDSRFQVDPREENIMENIPDDGMVYYSDDSEEEEESKPRKSKGPLLSNTTLTVLRSCGKYLQMARLLKSISSEVIVALVQLFEYYLYTVHSFFSSDMPATLCGNSSSSKLLSVLVRIKESLIQTNEEQEEANKIFRAMISPMVNLNTPNTLYGLSERVVAVESLIFLAQEYTLLKPYLEKLVPPQSTSSLNLNQFYSQTIPIINDVRKSVYACVSWRTVDIKQTLAMMSKVDWEVKEVMNHHSKYVDFMLDDIELFDKRLKEVKKNIFVPEAALKVIWDCLILLMSNIFVEGFASSKKCSGGGRGLMQFDFAQIEEKLVKKCQIHPLPHKEFVESYIRVYYHPEEEYLEKWIKEHQEYTSKQLIALVSCACQSNKKARQKLILLIEELDKKR